LARSSATTSPWFVKSSVSCRDSSRSISGYKIDATSNAQPSCKTVNLLEILLILSPRGKMHVLCQNIKNSFAICRSISGLARIRNRWHALGMLLSQYGLALTRLEPMERDRILAVCVVGVGYCSIVATAQVHHDAAARTFVGNDSTLKLCCARV